MKPVIRLRIADDDIGVTDLNLQLSLNGCGRGFITVQSTAPLAGLGVRLDLGVNDTVYRYFTGYVERTVPAASGTTRLFVREAVGLLETDFPVSLQHPTLSDVLVALTAASGQTFTLPEADYTATRIPHFTHAGSGYHLLDNLGRAFGIDDCIWSPQPDGRVYVGRHADTRFGQNPITLPTALIRQAVGSNGLEMMLFPAIRPGVVLNGRRVTAVNVRNETMTLTWAAAGKTPEQRQVDRAYPELADGLHLPRRARVVSATDTASLGDLADPFRPRYAVNVQLLDEHDNDVSGALFAAVPLPVPMAGSEGGMFQFPPEGALVEMGFTDGRQDKPFIRQTLPEGLSLPAIAPGEQLQQQREGVSQRVTTAGDWQRQTDQAIEETSRTRVVTSDAETRTTTTRTTTVQANDTTTVLGTHTTRAGAIVQLAEGDITQGTAGSLVEKVGRLRRSVSDLQQQYVAPQSWVGSSETNILQCLLDTLDLVQQLAEQTAEHTHSNTGTPTNGAALAGTGARAGTTHDTYAGLIE